MIAFHNDPTIKRTYLARVKAHRAADEIIKGTYWQDGKGCAVGCTVHSNAHAAYETELGIPRVLARLEDGIFEGLPNADAKNWPGQFLSAIPVGADLSLVWPRFAVWLLTDPTHGVLQYAKTDRTRSAIQRVSDLYGIVVAGGVVSEKDWRDAATAAASATAADAYATTAATAAATTLTTADAATAAYATTAADAAATAASATTADAATAAAYATTAATYADYHIKKQAAWQQQAKKLLQLLRATRLMQRTEGR